jgi:hypothetical protein
MKLVVESLKELDMIPVRLRAQEGAVAARMTHEFEVAGVCVGKAGEWVVQLGEEVQVLTHEAFQAKYQKVQERKPKDAAPESIPEPTVKPAKAAK